MTIITHAQNIVKHFLAKTPQKTHRSLTKRGVLCYNAFAVVSGRCTAIVPSQGGDTMNTYETIIVMIALLALIVKMIDMLNDRK